MNQNLRDHIKNHEKYPHGISDIVGLSEYKERNNIENEFNGDYAGAYSEITYSTGVIAAINTWDNSDKDNKLFSKTISYNLDGTIDEVELTDEKTSAVLTTSITYNVDGTVATITRAVT